MASINEMIVKRHRQAAPRMQTLNNVTALRNALRRYEEIVTSYHPLRVHESNIVDHERSVEKDALYLSFMKAGWQIVETMEYRDNDSALGTAVFSLRVLSGEEREQVRIYMAEILPEV